MGASTARCKPIQTMRPRSKQRPRRIWHSTAACRAASRSRRRTCRRQDIMIEHCDRRQRPRGVSSAWHRHHHAGVQAGHKSGRQQVQHDDRLGQKSLTGSVSSSGSRSTSTSPGGSSSADTIIDQARPASGRGANGRAVLLRCGRSSTPLADNDIADMGPPVYRIVDGSRGK